MRCWLVEREYDDKGLVRLVYATPDGERRLVSERSAAMLQGSGVSASKDVDPDRLEAVTDAATRTRYREEVDRVQDNHGPDETV